MKINQNKLPRLLAFLLLFVLSLAKMGCKKADMAPGEEARQSTNSQLPTNASSLNEQVKRVLNDFKSRSSNAEFAKSFSKKYGNPLWDKSIVVPRTNRVKAGKGDRVNDTIIIIPVVEPNSTEVRTYIQAAINDNVQLEIHTANRYRSLPFSNSDKPINEAEKLAIRFMLLNKEVFNHTSFNITDKRLFNGKNGNNDTSRIYRKVVLKEKTAVSNAKMMYVEVCVDIVTTTNHCPFPGRCTGGGGSCDGCIERCVDISSSTICDGWWQDDGGGGGGWSDGGSTGGYESGGGGGGTGGSTGSDSCNGSCMICKAMPWGDTGGGGWEPVPVADPIPYYDDYATPPFIWTFPGDNGTTYTDVDPSMQPYFQFDISDNYESHYPRFTNMVKNLKTFVKSNPKVLSALQAYSGFTKQQILNHLTYGQGPLIKIEEMSGRFGYYNRNNGNNTLHIRASYVRGLEQAYLQSTQEATAFLLAITILHEYVHLGTTQNNISEGVYDFGSGFERDAFNVIVDDDNAGTVVIKISQYF